MLFFKVLREESIALPFSLTVFILHTAVLLPRAGWKIKMMTSKDPLHSLSIARWITNKHAVTAYFIPDRESCFYLSLREVYVSNSGQLLRCTALIFLGHLTVIINLG